MNVNNPLNVSFENLLITNLQKDVNIFMHVYNFQPAHFLFVCFLPE